MVLADYRGREYSTDADEGYSTVQHGMVGIHVPKSADSVLCRFPRLTFLRLVGTMATATTLLSRELDSTALRVVAMMLSTAVIFLWLFILVRTVVAAFVGNIL